MSIHPSKLKMKTKKSGSNLKARSVSQTKSTSKISVFQKGDASEGSPEFEEDFPMTCLLFKCPCTVVVWKDQQRDEVFSKTSTRREPSVRTKKRIQIVTPSANAISSDQLHEPSVAMVGALTRPQSDANTIVVNSVYDFLNRLAELCLDKVPRIPRVFMQVLAFYTPFYKYLNKITFKRCAINVYTIHELCKILKTSTITEVYLDDSPLPQFDYGLLLDVPSHLKNLSLSRCNANDEICKQLASKLDHFASPGARTLTSLTLTSNQITDEGAKYLATALRSNRTLHYLNLSGNRITDIGAGAIFDVLVEFPLTSEETIARRKRHIKYLKEKWDLLLKYTDEIVNTYENKSTSKQKTVGENIKKKGKRSSPMKERIATVVLSYQDIKARVAKMVDNTMGPFTDPFSSSNVVVRDGSFRCLGNMALNYLNFAYNNLEYASLKKILAVLNYHKGHAGLMKVVLDGNYMPHDCSEMFLIDNIFDIYLMKYRATISRSGQSIRQASNRHKHGAYGHSSALPK